MASERDAAINRVIQKIEAVSGVGRERYEHVQVVKYTEGQYYRAHHDTGALDGVIQSGKTHVAHVASWAAAGVNASSPIES